MQWSLGLPSSESSNADLPESRGGPRIGSRNGEHFSVWWQRGLILTRYRGPLTSAPSSYRDELREHEAVMAAAIRSMPGPFVTIIDATNLGRVHGAFAHEGVNLIRRLPRRPIRRALRIGDGRFSRAHSALVHLATAGRLRVFRGHQLGDLVDFVVEPGVVDAHELYRLLDAARGTCRD